VKVERAESSGQFWVLAEDLYQAAVGDLRNRDNLSALEAAEASVSCALRAVLADRCGGKLPGELREGSAQVLMCRSQAMLTDDEYEARQSLPNVSAHLRGGLVAPEAEDVARYLERVNEVRRWLVRRC
jgi:hypothetical protein